MISTRKSFLRLCPFFWFKAFYYFGLYRSSFFPLGSFLLFQNMINNYMLTNMRICRIFYVNYKMKKEQPNVREEGRNIWLRKIFVLHFRSYKPPLFLLAVTRNSKRQPSKDEQKKKNDGKLSCMQHFVSFGVDKRNQMRVFDIL